ncbi:MAG TPA: chemotaxis protein CheB [Myxococcales bacterium]
MANQGSKRRAARKPALAAAAAKRPAKSKTLAAAKPVAPAPGRKRPGKPKFLSSKGGATPAKPERAPAPNPVEDARPKPATEFPIVGIGASAGGLEALEQFLKNVPKNCGMAFVVVQHLDPTHKGMLVELLQRMTPMPVVQAKDRLRVERDSVYVIPPNKDMSLLHGFLHLLTQTSPRGLNLPIDFFFRSLAEDQQERAIGVILSGMGSDGTLGLRAVKEKAGAVFVQSLASAKFDGMPRSAIDAGLADVVAPVEELPAKIIAYREHAPHLRGPETVPLEDKTQSALEKVFVLLRSQTGNDFSLYKKSTIYRRVERRMGLHQIDSIAHYVRFLRENPREIDLLFRELLIGVTSFFRDPPAWEHLKKEVMPALLSTRATGGVLRAWVPGCSTGEEAYSLAIVFKEALEPLKPVRNIALQVFATDLDRDAIEKARGGMYPANIAADVSPERLRRYFVQDERGFRVSKEIREMVVFAPQNLIMDPPFTKLDLLSCRNLLIYLSSELQKKLIPLFHYSLNPGGVLFLGSAETVGGFSSLFTPLDGKTRLYRRLDQTVISVPLEFPVTVASAPDAHGDEGPERPLPGRPTPQNLQALADRVLVQRFAPVGVLCNDKGDVLYVSGRAGRYLEPAVGKANLNLFAMAREGLRYDLSAAFATALREQHPVVVEGVKVGTNGGTQQVNLTVQKLAEPKELRGTVMVVFTDAPQAAAARPARAHRASEGPHVAQLESELHRAHEELQTTREEMQTSQEELKSTNEELQSTNEELTTSKEEMQSLNEELQTVNHELQSKVDELSRSNNDMKNLLNSTDIATLFLDGELHVRRFATPTTKIIKLIPGDAGRPITDLVSDLDYPDLADDAREVLRSLIFKEKLAATQDGRCFSVRIMPYRTLENVIDGLVITFTDASASRALETALREQASQLRQMAESSPTLVWGFRPDGSCDYLSAQWVDYTGVPDAEQHGFGWLEQVHPEDRVHARDAWRAAVEGGRPLDVEFRLRGKGGGWRWFQVRAVPIRDSMRAIVRWYGTASDIEPLKLAEQRLAALVEHMEEAFLTLDSRRAVADLNPAAESLLGRPRQDVLGKDLREALPEPARVGFDQIFERARRDGAPVRFETELGPEPEAGWCEVRVYPQRCTDGYSVFVRRGAGRRGSATP